MKNKDIFIQENIYSCGACSIASIISYYDGYIPLEVILEDTNTKEYGTNALNLINALKKYGFDAYGMKENLDDIKLSILPAIVHTRKDGIEHFMVLYKIEKDKYITMDPAIGKKVYTKEEFKTYYTGYIIYASKLSEIPKYKKNKNLQKLLLEILNINKFPIIIILVMSIFTILLNILLSFHLKLLNLHGNIYKITSIFILITIMSILIDYFKNDILLKLIKTIDNDIISRFTNHIFKLPKKNLETKRVGEIIRKIENMTLIKDLFLSITIINTIDVLTIILVSVVLFCISIKLSLIYISTILVYSILSIILNRRMERYESNVTKEYEEYNGSLVEYISGIESIKNLNEEDYFLNRLENNLDTFTKKRYKRDFNYLTVDYIKTNIFKIGTLIINLVGYTLIRDSFTFIDLLTTTSLFNILYSAAESIILTFKKVIETKVIYKRACEFYSLEQESHKDNFNSDINVLSIKNLDYKYNKENIIRTFNLHIYKGDKILIRGPSGIGKSTLVKCISGYLDGYSGAITIDGINTKDIPKNELKTKIVYIGQNEHLFTDSIKNNIILSSSNLDDYKRVLKTASLEELINKLPNKDDSCLLEGGLNISGGERSRIILARALIKKPSLLIVDETLSSLNEELEDKILDNLLKMDEISLIYITHRDKTSKFNYIIDFRKGGDYEITRR